MACSASVLPLPTPATSSGVNPSFPSKRRRTEASPAQISNFLLKKQMHDKLSPRFFFAAAGCSASSKQGCQNEDRFEVSRITDGRQGQSGLFLGLFDGHGGCTASQFASDSMKNEFLRRMQESKSKDVSKCLKESFEVVDRRLYEKLSQIVEQAEIPKDRCCNCKFFMENPCSCMKTHHYAREGSTGTVVVLQGKELFVANIGDSEAVLFSYEDLVNDNKSVAKAILSSQKRHRMEEEEKSEFQEESFIKSAFKMFVGRYLDEKHSLDSAQIHISNLTALHTPTVDETNEDYRRIRQVARGRSELLSSKGMAEYSGDGIRQGRISRFNYVRLPGAHALNMTRAFGNYGHKVFNKRSDGSFEADFQNSAVVPVPALNKINLSDFNSNCFLVVGSDGLWDNLSKKEVNQIVLDVVKKNAILAWLKIESSEKYSKKTDELKAEVLLAVLAGRATRELTERAVAAKRKLDDVTVVVVLFGSILSIYL